MPFVPDDERGAECDGLNDGTVRPTSDGVSSARPSVGRSSPQSYAGLARGVRERLRSRKVTDVAYRVTVGLIGLAITIGGLFLVPLPGPGWLIVILGLAILASEFDPAQRLLDFVKDKVTAWTHWVGRQGWPVRIAIGFGTLLAVAVGLWLALMLTGVPTWLPDGVSTWLVSSVPGL